MANELVNFNLDTDRRAALVLRAASLTMQRGARVTVSDLLREAVEYILNADEQPAVTGTGKGRVIRFRARPNVDKAIRRAAEGSGRSVDEVVNAMLADAMQIEEVRA